MSQENEWKSVGQIAKRLRQMAVRAMNAGMFEVAESYDSKATDMLVNQWLEAKGKQK